MLILIFLLIIGATLSLYYYFIRRGKVTLPDELLAGKETKETKKKVDLTQIIQLLTPVTQRLEKNKFIPFAQIKRKLISAGNTIGIPEFFAFKILAMIFVPLLAFIFWKDSMNLVIFLVSLAIGYVLPDIWLKRRIQKRQFEIIKDMPNLIDLLSLCVGGGLDFMVALARITKDFKKGPLRDELEEILHEGHIGKSKQDSLRNLAYRVDMPEVYSFARTLIQADKMGTPVQDALKIQSDEIRLRRFQRGEEQALKAPIKLLFPLMFFIMPVVLIIVGGPILLQFLRGGIKF